MRIFISRYLNETYTNPEPLYTINSFGNVTCPFISPDESYIIFFKEIDGRGSDYICFKDRKGKWQPPVLIKEIRSSTTFVTRDGKYLFNWFHWISTEILNDLKPKD